MVGPVQYSRQVVKEAKRIRWPKPNLLVKTILTVVVISALFAAILALEDLAGGSLLNALKQAFKGWK